MTRWIRAWFTLALVSAAVQGRAQPIGYCDGGCSAEMGDIVPVLSIALGTEQPEACPAADRDDDDRVTVADIILANRGALGGDACQTPIGLCGDSVLDPNEQCDGIADAACPGRCQPPTPPVFDCITCGGRTGPCSGPADASCAGQCVLQTASCTCVPNPTANCPPPQILPDPGAPYFCPAACAQIGARLYYREERTGGQFTEQEIEVVDFVNPAEPGAVRVRARTTNQDGTTALDTVLDFGGGSGGIVLPPAANAIWGTLAMYPQLVCGWPLGCAPDGSVLIPNGQQYAFTADIGLGQSAEIQTSCSGCGGSTTRVNASWAGARCGLDTFSQRPVLCRGFNPYVPIAFAVQCCGCAGDEPCAGGTTCIDAVCQ